nr:immunoglobulin heavy chain junction region [Macaca mulatta]
CVESGIAAAGAGYW